MASDAVRPNSTSTRLDSSSEKPVELACAWTVGERVNRRDDEHGASRRCISGTRRAWVQAARGATPAGFDRRPSTRSGHPEPAEVRRILPRGPAGNPPSLATAPLNEATCRAGPRGRLGAGRPAVWEIACVARGGVVSYSYKDEYAKTPVVGAPARAGSRHDAPRQPVGHHPHLWAACLPLPPRPAARTPYLLDVPHPGGPLQRALCAGRGARALSAGGRGLGSGLGGGDPARAAQPRADRACPAGARTPGA